MMRDKPRGILKQWQDIDCLKMCDAETVKANRRRILNSEKSSGDHVSTVPNNMVGQSLLIREQKQDNEFQGQRAYINKKYSRNEEKPTTYAERLLGCPAKISSYKDVHKKRKELLASCSRKRNSFKTPFMKPNSMTPETETRSAETNIETSRKSARITEALLRTENGIELKDDSFFGLEDDNIASVPKKKTYNDRLFGCSAQVVNSEDVIKTRKEILGGSVQKKNFKAPQPWNETSSNQIPAGVSKLLQTSISNSAELGGSEDVLDSESVLSLFSGEPSKETSLHRSTTINAAKNILGCNLLISEDSLVSHEFSPNVEVPVPPKVSYTDFKKPAFERRKKFFDDSESSNRFRDEEDTESKIKYATKKEVREALDEKNKIMCGVLGGFSSAQAFHDTNKFEDTNWVEDFDEKEQLLKKKRRKSKKRKGHFLDDVIEGHRPSNKEDEIVVSGSDKVIVVENSFISSKPSSHKEAHHNDPKFLAIIDEHIPINEATYQQQEIACDQKIKSSKQRKTDFAIFDAFEFVEQSDFNEVQGHQINSEKNGIEKNRGVNGNFENSSVNGSNIDDINSKVCERDYMDVSFLSDSHYLPFDTQNETPSKNPDVLEKTTTNSVQMEPRNSWESSLATSQGHRETAQSCASKPIGASRETITDLISDGNMTPYERSIDSDSIKNDQSELANETTYTSVTKSVRKDGRKILSTANSLFKTPLMKSKSEKSKSNRKSQCADPFQTKTIRNLLNLSLDKTHEQLKSLYKIPSGVQFTFEAYRNHLLQQARIFCMLSIMPAYDSFIGFWTDNRNKTILNIESICLKSNFLVLKDAQMSFSSKQHDKILSKIKHKTYEESFYVQIPPNKSLFSSFSRNDVWIIIPKELKGHFMARSIMPWPLWNGHLHLQLLSCPLKFDMKFFIRTNKEVNMVRIASSVNDLDCLDCISTNLADLVGVCTNPVFESLCDVVSNHQSNSNDHSLSSRKRNAVIVKPEFCEMVLSLADEFEQVFNLNDQQKTALNNICYSICSENSNEVTMLIHGVFGSGKSFLLAVFIHFLVNLANQCAFEDSENFSIMVCSGTNVAVDNVLGKYIEIVKHSAKCELLEENAENISEEEVEKRLNEILSGSLLRIGNVQKISMPMLRYSLHHDLETDNLKQLAIRLKDKELKK